MATCTHSTTTPLPPADAELLALLPKLVRRDRAYSDAVAWVSPMDDTDPDYDAADEASAAAARKYDKTLKKMTRLRPSTVAGLKAKARAAAIACAYCTDERPQIDDDVRIMRALVDDVLAMPEGGAA